MFRALAIAALAACSLFGVAQAQQLTAEHFSRRQAIWSGALSPNGNLVAAIQAADQGDALVVIDWRARRSTALQVARHDRSMFLMAVDWKSDDRLVFVVRQRATMVYENTGSRNFSAEAEEYDVYRVFAVNRDGSNLVQMFEGQTNRLASRDGSVGIIDTLPHDPQHILLGAWGNRGFTLYRADINTGQVQSVEDADWDTYDLIVDSTGRSVMRIDALPYGAGRRIFRRGPGQRSWTLAHEVRGLARSENREFAPIAAGPQPGQVYVAARREGDEYQALYLYDTATGQLGEPIFRHDNADVGVAWINNADGSLVFGCGVRQRLECRASNSEMQRHFSGLANYFENLADFRLASISRDGQQWLVIADGPTIPATYYVYDVEEAQVAPVMSTAPQIPRASLSQTRVVNYTSRDGAQLWGYLTTPAGAGPRATVILPHGGPQARDTFGYDPFVQFLVSRGYAVFQPNFRGSEGSGRSFAAAGFRQWGGRMQDDISDGVRHLIDTGVADAQRICIVGFSYGGYAALAGVTLTPELYRCAISIAGISDLPELLESSRSDAGRRSTLYAHDVERIGDPDRDRDALNAASPRRNIDRIQVPVLLIHGELDTIVDVQQSERMANALQRAGKSQRSLRVPNAYHPYDGWTVADVRRLYEETEGFLAENLGPR